MVGPAATHSPLNVSAGYQTTDAKNNKFKLGSVAGSYDFGVAKVNLLLSQIKFAQFKQSIVTVGAIVPVTANGFFTALDPDLAERLAPLDGAALGPDRTEAALSAEIGALLGY